MKKRSWEWRTGKRGRKPRKWPTPAPSLKPQFDPWCLTFAYLWYEGTEDHERIINIDRDRVRRGVPSLFG